MTTIVAVAREGRVVIGSDTMTNVYDRPMIGVARKVVRRPIESGGEVLMAFSGDGALSSLSRRLKITGSPAVDDPEDQDCWADAVAQSLSEIAVDAGVSDGGQMDGSALLGWNGNLWHLTHQQAIRCPDGIGALGSGEGPAIGALDALLGSGVPVVDAVSQAVFIGIERDRFSQAPVQLELLEMHPTTTPPEV